MSKDLQTPATKAEGLSALITGAMIAALREYRDVPEMKDGPAYSGLSVRETWLADRAVNLMLNALAVYGQTGEGKRKVEATKALKAAAAALVERYPDDPTSWPTELYTEISTASEALDKAKEADL